MKDVTPSSKLPAQNPPMTPEQQIADNYITPRNELEPLTVINDSEARTDG
jgi:hypothetical protein